MLADIKMSQFLGDLSPEMSGCLHILAAFPQSDNNSGSKAEGVLSSSIFAYSMALQTSSVLVTRGRGSLVAFLNASDLDESDGDG